MNLALPALIFANIVPGKELGDVTPNYLWLFHSIYTI